MDDKRKWARVVRLANADASNDWALVTAFRNMAVAFGALPHLNGAPALGHPALVDEARALLPSLRVLLRLASGIATKAERSRAEHILSEHRAHVSIPVISVPLEMPPAAGAGTGGFGGFLHALGLPREVADPPEPTGERRAAAPEHRVVAELDASIPAGAKVRLRQPPNRTLRQVTVYRDALDPVCDLVQSSGFEPVRACQLCGKFFVRAGRQVHCSLDCKTRRLRPKCQLSTPDMRDYQARRRAEKLPREALEAWIEKLGRRKMSAARKGRLLAILRSVMRSGVQHGVHANNNHVN